jgi:polyhydroxybutyrate depolymerase
VFSRYFNALSWVVAGGLLGGCGNGAAKSDDSTEPVGSTSASPNPSATAMQSEPEPGGEPTPGAEAQEPEEPPTGVPEPSISEPEPIPGISEPTMVVEPSPTPEEAEMLPTGEPTSEPQAEPETTEPTVEPAMEPQPAEPSTGCGAGAAESGARSLEVDGQERTFLLDLPSTYDGAEPYPLVFGFHGASTDGDLFRSQFYGNLLSAMGEEAIVVHPDALGDPTSWDTETDIGFVAAMIDELGATLCVDAQRVFATGHSSGGFFTNALGCELGDVLRGIAPVSGGGPFTFGGGGCEGQVAAWIAHGENDETVAFSNGESSRDIWAEANGCDLAMPLDVEPSGCVEYQGCDDGHPVRFCVYQDGHNWPEYAPQAIWDFWKTL